MGWLENHIGKNFVPYHIGREQKNKDVNCPLWHFTYAWLCCPESEKNKLILPKIGYSESNVDS